MLSRVVTAAVGIPLLTYVALVESLWPAKTFVVLIAVVGTIEIYHAERNAPMFMLAAACSIFVVAILRAEFSVIWPVATGALAMFLVIALEVSGVRGGGIGRSISAMLFQVGFLLFPLWCVVWLRARDVDADGLWTFSTDSALLLLFVCLWAGDTLAFFVGRAVGKHKLAPRISPSKTWEGALANLIAAVIAGLFVAPPFGMPLWLGGSVGAIVGTFGQAGDFLESAWKRSCGVKDSGIVLPGHGGVLDRFDSLLFTAPAVSLIFGLVDR